MDKPFLQTLNLYRGKSAMQISPSPELALVFVSLAPVIPGMENKMPDKNTKKYLWDRKLTASFNFEGALEVAAAAAALAEGRESVVADSKGPLPSWYRDPAKCGRDGNAKIIGQRWTQYSNDGPRRLLCTRSERPHGCRAAEQRDELASQHSASGLRARLFPTHTSTLKGGWCDPDKCHVANDRFGSN